MSQVFTWPAQSITATNPSVGINGAVAPAQSTQVAGQDSSGDLIPLLVDATGELQVNVTNSVLPTGAATEATLLQVDSDIQAGNVLLTAIESDTTAMAASLSSIDGKLANPMPVSGPLTDTQLRASAVAVTGPLTDTQLRASAVPVSAASLPLPSGAATEAKQDTGNASLASIDSKLTAPLSVTGPLTDTELRATPVPVSGPLTDTQLRASAVPVSAAALPLPSGAATEAKQDSQIALLSARLTGSLVPAAFDEVVLTYVPSGPGVGQIQTAVYKLATVTVKTLTLSYDGSDRLSGVVAS